MCCPHRPQPDPLRCRAVVFTPDEHDSRLRDDERQAIRGMVAALRAGRCDCGARLERDWRFRHAGDCVVLQLDRISERVPDVGIAVRQLEVALP